MEYCKRCVMPNTRPGIEFNEDGICYPCLRFEERKNINWEKRQKKLKEITDSYKSRKSGDYNCLIPVSGGKDSYFQTYLMKEVYDMNPLLLAVVDPFTHTKNGKYNLKNLSETFEADLIKYELNPSSARKMVRIAFEEKGSPTWPIDLAIYSVPLKIANKLNIPLVIYGENVSYEYGGPNSEETYSAKEQVKNNVAESIDEEWWFERGVVREDIDFIKYPSQEAVDNLEPIYLSYFYPWDGYHNYLLAKKFGFKDVKGEWEREGFIEYYDQIDSLGYVVHPWLKYPKYGHARATDVASLWIRNGYIDREEAIKLVRDHDHKLDQKALNDFLNFSGYTQEEFWNIVEKFWNKDIFELRNGFWRLKEPIWEKEDIDDNEKPLQSTPPKTFSYRKGMGVK